MLIIYTTSVFTVTDSRSQEVFVVILAFVSFVVVNVFTKALTQPAGLDLVGAQVVFCNSTYIESVRKSNTCLLGYYVTLVFTDLGLNIIAIDHFV